ncbi:uncharacterized protein MELLADRAFT_104564 [Melampsora larici-populina 98AG31]|uniref:Uncharacterized protein n=1 Tax=Melampsora larici-populina (strain 98AG31 / pathotype 3-4-7) TaxID=747676 RepID=F4RF47_MELLP|nr:uncharacterized protein MELLADRAFT_104564 [Melampsora larici-populina 98AG31]EGG08754.1 hypothetical protein MELLADRAFT_104564 [Melampsora larici-populina 98AG31]
MSREEDGETIRYLRTQVEALEPQTAELDQSRQETADLQRMVRELLAKRSRPGSIENDAGEADRTREISQAEGSNTFNQYVNTTPTSPSPLPRDSRPVHHNKGKQEPKIANNHDNQRDNNLATHRHSPLDNHISR